MALPPMGPRVEIVSSTFPDNLYNINIGAFLSVYVCLVSGALMAPKYRRWVVVFGVMLNVGCGGPFNFPFWQEHFSLPPDVSNQVLIFDGLACLLAFGTAHILDVRMNNRSANLGIADQPDSLGQVASQ